MNVDVVGIAVFFDALILFERVADLVPDLGPFTSQLRLTSRPRAPRAEAGVPQVQQEAGVEIRVVSICVQHVHALRHHGQCGDARLDPLLRLLAVRSIWLVEHALWDVGGDEEDVLEEVLVVLQVRRRGLQQRVALQTVLGPRCVSGRYCRLPHAAEDAVAHRVRHHVDAQRLLLLLEAGEELPEGAPGLLRVRLLVFAVLYRGTVQSHQVQLFLPAFLLVGTCPIDRHDKNSLLLR
eukprot:scaffold113327_cov66-Phaeocystis_antarctica.AAC.2